MSERASRCFCQETENRLKTLQFAPTCRRDGSVFVPNSAAQAR